MNTPLTKSEILEFIEAEHDRLARRMAFVSDAQLEAPGRRAGWAIRDVIAHVTAWEGRLIHWLECHRDHATPVEPPPGQDIDDAAFDRRAHDIGHQLSTACIKREFASTYARAVELVRSLSEEELSNRPDGNWTRHTLSALIAANTYLHYQWASKRLREWTAAPAVREHAHAR